MYGVIASPDKEQALIELIGEQIVYSSFQKSDKPEQLKRTLEMAARVPLNTLIVDASIGQGLVDAINAYRIQRPATRVILLADGRGPGDSTIAAAVQMGIYDIVSADDWGAELKEVLDQSPADYSAAAHWDVQIDINDEKESLSKGLLKRFIKPKETNSTQEKENVFIEVEMESKTDEPFFPVPTSSVNVPDDFAAIGHIQGVRSFSGITEVLAAAPSVVLVPGSADTVKHIKSLRREPSLLHVPIVVIGQTEEMLCYKAGADECYKVLSEEAVERIRAKADRMRNMWEKVSRDDLTGLFKRKYLEDYLVEQERRYKSIGVPFSLLLADLDHFKSVNDTYGHQAGDLVLKEFAAYLQGSVRRVDVVARYGGEEFVVVFPNLGDAGRIVEKLCSGWAKRDILIEDSKIRSTFSAGLAVIGKDALCVDDLIRAADQALYKAKNSGRNKVVKACKNNMHKAVAVSNAKAEIGNHKKPVVTRIKNIISVVTPAPQKKYANLIAVWSTAAAGKTFASVHLAAAFSRQGYKTVLISSDALKRGVSTGQLPMLTIFAEVDNNDYSMLTENWDVVVVDGCQEALKSAGQIIFVINWLFLKEISQSLEREERDWRKALILATGVSDMDAEIRQMESALRLKIDLIVPYIEDSSTKEKIQTKSEIAGIFQNATTQGGGLI